MKYSFKKEDVFSVLNSKESKEYIGKPGYFGDSLGELQNHIDKKLVYLLLKSIPDESNEKPFGMNDKNDTSDTNLTFYSLYVPTEKVQRVEGKYRPFTCWKEFYNNFLYYRNKITITLQEKKTKKVYVDLFILGHDDTSIILPLYGELTFKELFEKFYIQYKPSWGKPVFQPFGCEQIE